MNRSVHLATQRADVEWSELTTVAQQFRGISHVLPTTPMAPCSMCKAHVPRDVSSIAEYNTTTLIKHLKNHHINEYNGSTKHNEMKKFISHMPKIQETSQ